MRSMSIPRPKRSVDTRMRFLKSLKSLYLLIRSSWPMPEWMQTLGKLHSVSRRSSSVARATFETKITTWLKSKASSRSLSLRFFSARGENRDGDGHDDPLRDGDREQAIDRHRACLLRVGIARQTVVLLAQARARRLRLPTHRQERVVNRQLQVGGLQTGRVEAEGVRSRGLLLLLLLGR